MSSPRLHPCCNEPANMMPASAPSRPDTVIEICKVCGCRHFTFYADPIAIGVAPAQLEPGKAVA